MGRGLVMKNFAEAARINYKRRMDKTLCSYVANMKYCDNHTRIISPINLKSTASENCHSIGKYVNPCNACEDRILFLTFL
jgi:hypothetical protein